MGVSAVVVDAVAMRLDSIRYGVEVLLVSATSTILWT
jgi:hypothetical protein